MKVTGFLTPSYGWRLQAESEFLIVPDYCFKSRPGSYVAFIGIAHRKEMFMVSVGNDIADMFRHISEHYFFDRIYVVEVDYLN